MLAAAKFPVPGLSVDGDIISYEGIPVEQASESERLRLGAMIGAALNPQFPVALVREGACLDEQNLAEFLAFAEEIGLQAIVERTGAGAECSVIIEDGEVSEDRAGVVAPPEAEEAKPSRKTSKARNDKPAEPPANLLDVASLRTDEEDF
jgi:hypothetical protein